MNEMFQILTIFREEKSEQYVETQDELEETKEMLTKLRNEVRKRRTSNVMRIGLLCIVKGL